MVTCKCSAFTVIPSLRDFLAQEDLLALRSKGNVLELLAHAPTQHHFAGQAGGLFEIIRGPACRGTEDQVLSSAPAHHYRQTILHILARIDVLVLAWQLLCDPLCPSTGHNGDFMDGVGGRPTTLPR